MKMKYLLAFACALGAFALVGCHYDEPYYPYRSHHSHGAYYGRGYGGGYNHYEDEHRAAHHAEHDYYDHGD